MTEKWATNPELQGTSPVRNRGFFDIITRMDETLEEKVPTESLSTGLGRLGLFLLVIGLILGIILQVVAFIPIVGPIISGLLFIPLITVPIIFVVLGIILNLIFSLFIFIGAKIVGGQGSFGNQFGASTLILWPSAVLGILIIISYISFFVFSLIPFIGFFFLIPVFLLTTLLQYLSTYFLIVFVKQVHGLNTFKSVVGTSLGMALMVAVVLILGMLVLGAAFSNIRNASPAGLLGLA